MAVHAHKSKLAEVHRLAAEAINNRLKGTDYVMSRCLLGIWVEPDGNVVVHLNSGGNATAVMNALWRKHQVNTDIHPEYGVLVWTED